MQEQKIEATKYNIIYATISGIKNIEDEIRIDFLNSTLTKDGKVDLSNKKIKAIYGANGAGKSAIISAFDLYKKVCSVPNYLEQPQVVAELDEIINKKLKKASITVVFAYTKGEKVSNVYKHKISIFHGDIVPYQLEEELYEAKDKNKSNGEYKELLKVKDGSIMTSIQSEFIKKEIAKFEKLKLINSSICSNIIAIVNSLTKFISEEESQRKKNGHLSKDFNEHMIFYWSLLSIISVTYMINVYLDIKDRHQYKNPYFDIQKKLKEKKVSDDIIGLLSNSDEKYYFTSLSDIVLKEEIKEYEETYKKIRDFIKIIKPSLKDIIIEHTDYDKDNYKCRKIFVYNDYRIDMEYESTGIKKMVELYTYIKEAFDGGIVFIDEIDANISGVFLDKLMECFNENGKGQLCFTSHNYYSMNKLRKFITLTTIGETGMVVDISKNGNSNPANLFYNGDIMDSPFNIESYDFEKMFVDED